MNDRILDDDVPEEIIERTKVVVRVPATSANFGPGFDTIGSTPLDCILSALITN